MTKITISNRNNSAFEVSGKKPLLNELRDQGVDLPYGVRMEDVLHVQLN